MVSSTGTCIYRPICNLNRLLSKVPIVVISFSCVSCRFSVIHYEKMLLPIKKINVETKHLITCFTCWRTTAIGPGYSVIRQVEFHFWKAPVQTCKQCNGMLTLNGRKHNQRALNVASTLYIHTWQLPNGLHGHIYPTPSRILPCPPSPRKYIANSDQYTN